MRRYFMLTSEACRLVLQAASLAKNQEIFILDMGEPVRIVDLAKKMMELMGKEVPIKYIGLRPGEKLYEELLIDGSEESTKYRSIYIAKPTPVDFEELKARIEALLEAKSKRAILRRIAAIVEEFRHKDLR
jgi:UDP-N-acetyl-D-glucosamine 4,6-dehydratase